MQHQVEEVAVVEENTLRSIAKQIVIENFARGEDLAVLIVDALCFAGMIRAADIDSAIEIVRDEVEAHREAQKD